MTGKDDYETRRKREAEATERQEVAYQARMKREALADEVALLAMESLKAFFDGHAFLDVTPLHTHATAMPNGHYMTTTPGYCDTGYAVASGYQIRFRNP